MRTPIVTGFVRPRVVVPRTADAWDSAPRRTILPRELADVRLGDWILARR